MEKINNKIQLYIKLSVFLLILFVFAFFTKDGDSISLIDIAYQLPKSIGVYSVGVYIFYKWLWKLPLLKGWLVKVPNLQGTWRGFLKSDWINPETKKGIEPIPIILVVEQDFNHINCSIMTKESSSYTLSSDILYINGRMQLSYTYNNIPKNGVRNRSEIHNGASLLQIIEKPIRKLSGGYWTDRNTKGEIDVEFLDTILREEFTGDMFDKKSKK